MHPLETADFHGILVIQHVSRPVEFRYASCVLKPFFSILSAEVRSGYNLRMSEWLQVATTTAQKQDAERIASALVDQRLAACVQVVGPITSTYRWQNCVETSQEWLCLIKTSRDQYAAVEAAIAKLHPYDVPEIVATPIVAGSRSYLDWLRDELQSGKGNEE